MKKSFVLSLVACCTSGLSMAQTVPDLDPGVEFGVQLGDYTYRENPNFMELHADGLVAGNATLTLADLMGMGPVRLEGRFVNARVDYSSDSGTSADSTNYYLEARALWMRGFDTEMGTFVPYAGLGLRRLYNDLNDTATASGYTRRSTYIYAPLGMAYHTPESQYGHLGIAAEYGTLLWGRQYSGIYDGLTNKQTSGSHVRLTALWESEKWKLGPYYQFWRVDESDTDCAANGAFCGVEPKNFTREYGLSLQMEF